MNRRITLAFVLSLGVFYLALSILASPVYSRSSSPGSGWQAATSLPAPLSGALGLVVKSQSLVTLGGQDSSSGSPLVRVLRNEIRAGADLGTLWDASGNANLDTPRALHGAVLSAGGDHVYLIGGWNGSDALNSVRYAAMDATGHVVGSWQEASDLPGPRMNLGAAVSGNLIYVAGGWDGFRARPEVYVTTVQSDGSLNDWRAVSALPVPLFSSSLTASGSYLYVVGGHDGSRARNEVYRARVLDTQGTLSAWEELTFNALPSPRERHAAVVYQNRLVVLGGRDQRDLSSASVLVATLNADGSLGAWQTSFLPSLPQPVDRHAAVVANVPGCGEVIYVVGGRSGDAYRNTVYHTPCTNMSDRVVLGLLIRRKAVVPPEIYGRILQMGAGVAGVKVNLHFFNGAQWSDLQQVVTDASGNYSFPGVAPLSTGQMYNVAYANWEENDTRLTYVQSFAITSYPGGRISGGDLQVQNISHTSPANAATVSFPAKFCWQPRGVSGDAYYLVLEDSAQQLHWFAAGSAACFELAALPSGFQYGQTYRWSIGVDNDPADDYEWGRSYYHRDVTFQAGPTTAGINGLVTYNGAPAAGIALGLHFFNGTNESEAATTTTGTNGRYAFTGMPSLGTGQKYYVHFGPNGSNSNYLFNWYGPDITSYIAGTALPGGDFDIADVRLLSPPNGSTLALPVTFTWQRRGLPGDTYRWILFDPQSSDRWYTGDLGDVGGVTITGLNPTPVYGKQYGWYVRVFHGADSYGESYYYGLITFSSSQVTTPGGLPAPTVPADAVLGGLHPAPPAVAGLPQDTMWDWRSRGGIVGGKPAEVLLDAGEVEILSERNAGEQHLSTMPQHPQPAEGTASRLDNGK